MKSLAEHRQKGYYSLSVEGLETPEGFDDHEIQVDRGSRSSPYTPPKDWDTNNYGNQFAKEIPKRQRSQKVRGVEMMTPYNEAWIEVRDEW